MIRLMFSIAFVNIAYVICQWSSINTEPALLVVSYDAFHPDYLNRNVTPNLNKFRKEGASAQYLFNVFATETFVNHFSIATVSVLLIKIHSFFQNVFPSVGFLRRNSWCVVKCIVWLKTWKILEIQLWAFSLQ